MAIMRGTICGKRREEGKKSIRESFVEAFNLISMKVNAFN
jgi:hypothetical protein